MEYIEMPEWKELKKAKKYKEAADKLMYEIAVNLIMVHNKYSDVKYDPYTDDAVAYGTIWYAKDSNDNPIEEMRRLRVVANALSGVRIEYCYHSSIKTLNEYKEILKDTIEIKKKMLREIKKV